MQVAEEDMTSAALLRRYIMQHQKLADNLLPPLASDILDSHGLHCNACSGMCRLRYDILSLPTSLLEFSASVLQNVSQTCVVAFRIFARSRHLHCAFTVHLVTRN